MSHKQAVLRLACVLVYSVLVAQLVYCQSSHPCGADLSSFVQESTLANQSLSQDFSCVLQEFTSSFDQGSIVWKKNGTELPLGSKYSLTGATDNLRIMDVNPSDEGIYTCTYESSNTVYDGKDEYCFTVQGVPVLEKCSDCIQNVTNGTNFNITVTFKDKFTGFDETVAEVNSIIVRRQSTLIARCDTGCTVIENFIPMRFEDQFPEVTFVVSETENAVLYTVLATVSVVTQSYIITVSVIASTPTMSQTTDVPGASTSIEMKPTISPTTPADNNTDVNGSVTNLSATAISIHSSASSSTASVEPSTNSSRSNGEVIVGISIVVAVLVAVFAVVIVIAFLYFTRKKLHKYTLNGQGSRIKGIRMPDLSTVGGEDDRKAPVVLDDKSNSEPRTV